MQVSDPADGRTPLDDIVWLIAMALGALAALRHWPIGDREHAGGGAPARSGGRWW